MSDHPTTPPVPPETISDDPLCLKLDCPACGLTTEVPIGGPAQDAPVPPVRCARCRTRVVPMPAAWRRSITSWTISVLPGVLILAVAIGAVLRTLTAMTDVASAPDDAYDSGYMAGLITAQIAWGLLLAAGPAINLTLWLILRRHHPWWGRSRRTLVGIAQWCLGLFMVIPCFGIVVGLIVPGVAMFDAGARRPTNMQTACGCCGYDVRSTPDRCPECGTDVAWVTDPTTPVHGWWLVAAASWLAAASMAALPSASFSGYPVLWFGLPSWLFPLMTVPIASVGLGIVARRAWFIALSIPRQVAACLLPIPIGLALGIFGG